MIGGAGRRYAPSSSANVSDGESSAIYSSGRRTHKSNIPLDMSSDIFTPELFFADENSNIHLNAAGPLGSLMPLGSSMLSSSDDEDSASVIGGVSVAESNAASELQASKGVTPLFSFAKPTSSGIPGRTFMPRPRSNSVASTSSNLHRVLPPPRPLYSSVPQKPIQPIAFLNSSNLSQVKCTVVPAGSSTKRLRTAMSKPSSSSAHERRQLQQLQRQKQQAPWTPMITRKAHAMHDRNIPTLNTNPSNINGSRVPLQVQSLNSAHSEMDFELEDMLLQPFSTAPTAEPIDSSIASGMAHFQGESHISPSPATCINMITLDDLLSDGNQPLSSAPDHSLDESNQQTQALKDPGMLVDEFLLENRTQLPTSSLDDLESLLFNQMDSHTMIDPQESGSEVCSFQTQNPAHRPPRSATSNTRNQRQSTNFVRRMAAKAAASKDRALSEREQYSQFVRSIFEKDCNSASGNDLLDDGENDDDEVYKEGYDDDDDDNTTALYLRSEESASDANDAPMAIPMKELYDLFEINSDPDDSVVCCSCYLDPSNSHPSVTNAMPNDMPNPDTSGTHCNHCNRPFKVNEFSPAMHNYWNAPAQFDSSFVEKFNYQLGVHFQLLVQNLALCGEIRDADASWVSTLKLMLQAEYRLGFLDDNCCRSGSVAPEGMSLLCRILYQSPLHRPLLKKPSQLLGDDPDLRLKSSIVTVPFILKHMEARKAVLSSSFWHIQSIFGPSFDSQYQLIPPSDETLAAGSESANADSRSNRAVQNSRQQLDLTEKSSKSKQKEVIPFTFVLSPTKEAGNVCESSSALGSCSIAADSSLTTDLSGRVPSSTATIAGVVWEPKSAGGIRNDSFLPIEDRLLLLGMHRFGMGNWEKIQSHYLPTRSAKQLAVRFKNLTARRAAPNPVKDFATKVSGPLTKVEWGLLKEGVRTYGVSDWAKIAERYLPNRPALILQKFWHEMNRPASSGRMRFLDVEFPSDDDNDSDYG